MTTGLFIGGGSGDQWNGLALGNLDMNNFSITNVNTITILQTATTGQALDVSRNLAAASTDSAIVCFYNLNAGDDQPVLTVRSASNAASANAMVIFETTDAAFDQVLWHGIQDGTGGGMLLHITAATGGIGFDLDQDADNYGMLITSVATTNTMYALQVLSGTGATVANFQVTGAEFARIGMTNDANGSFWFYRNLAAASTAGAVVKIEQSHADDDQGALYVVNDSDADALNPMVLFESTNAAYDQNVLLIRQAGDAMAVFIDTEATTQANYGLQIQSGTGCTTAQFWQSANQYVDLIRPATDATGQLLFYRNLAAANTNCPMVKFFNDEATDDQRVLWISQDCPADSIYIDHNNSGIAVNIDMAVNAGGNMFGLKLDIANAGAGLEYAFWIANAALERAAGTETTTKYVRCQDSGNAEYYLKLYSVA